MKKIVLAMGVALISLALTGLLAACGSTGDKEAIQDGLTSELEQLKDPRSPLWLDNIAASEGGLTEDFVNTWAQSYSFEIGEITVEGDTATATVSITCKQLYPIVGSIQAALSNNETFAGMTAEEAAAKVPAIAQEELEKAQAVTTEISIPCEKQDNTWSEGVDAPAEYEKALLGSTPSL
jgi:hypothetical protein